jgi:hypothetical protein
MIPGTGSRDSLPTNVKTKATEFHQRDGTVLYGIQVLRPTARWVDFTRNGKIDLYKDPQARDDMREYLRKLPDPKRS